MIRPQIAKPRIHCPAGDLGRDHRRRCCDRCGRPVRGAARDRACGRRWAGRDRPPQRAADVEVAGPSTSAGIRAVADAMIALGGRTRPHRRLDRPPRRLRPGVADARGDGDRSRARTGDRRGRRAHRPGAGAGRPGAGRDPRRAPWRPGRRRPPRPLRRRGGRSVAPAEALRLDRERRRRRRPGPHEPHEAQLRTRRHRLRTLPRRPAAERLAATSPGSSPPTRPRSSCAPARPSGTAARASASKPCATPNCGRSPSTRWPALAPPQLRRPARRDRQADRSRVPVLDSFRSQPAARHTPFHLRSTGSRRRQSSSSVLPLNTDSRRSATTSEPGRACSSLRLISSHCGFSPRPGALQGEAAAAASRRGGRRRRGRARAPPARRPGRPARRCRGPRRSRRPPRLPLELVVGDARGPRPATASRLTAGSIDGPFRHRPGAHHPVDLEAQVEVVGGRRVLLDDEDAGADAADRELLVALDLDAPRPRPRRPARPAAPRAGTRPARRPPPRAPRRGQHACRPRRCAPSPSRRARPPRRSVASRKPTPWTSPRTTARTAAAVLCLSPALASYSSSLRSLRCPRRPRTRAVSPRRCGPRSRSGCRRPDPPWGRRGGCSHGRRSSDARGSP